jgi:pimeloyl-ACP methyl ester carboxylesterase
VTDIINAGFTPAPPWLTGNLQTVADRIRPRHHDLSAVSTEQRLLVAMTDGSGDALAVRIHRPRIGPRPDRPMTLFVHGLGGSIDSTYVRATTLGLLRAGYAVARVDLRGVGDSSEHCRMLYHGGRSADLQLVPKSHWMVGTSAPTHGTPHAYDQRVPVILMGWGIKAGRYLTSSAPVDIAPTLAYLSHVSLPRADGRVLTEAVIR